MARTHPSDDLEGSTAASAIAGGLHALTGARIIVVLGGLVAGGAERQALLLAEHLAHEQRAEVEMWAFRDPHWAAARCDELKIPWRIVPVEWSANPVQQWTAFNQLTGALRGARPDVLISYTRLPNMLCGLAWRRIGARLMVWHQTGLSHMGGLLERLAVRLTPRFVARAQHLADLLIGTLGADPWRVQVIHGGVRLAPPVSDRGAWRARLGVPDAGFVACMVAHLKGQKDHATLVRAWRRVVDQLEAHGWPGLLVLAGRLGRPHEGLKQVVEELHLGAHVAFLGEIEDVSGLLSAADLGVFSSLSEGLPNAILEYMAAGLPVVSTDIPGIREALGADGQRWLAPPGDAESLAERIWEVASSAPLRRELGRANRAWVAGRFSPERALKQTVDMIVGAM